MYQGGTYHRRLWQNKPKQYGPWSIVARTLKDRLENGLGVAYKYVTNAIPLWEKAGDPHNYAISESFDIGLSAWDNNGLDCPGSSRGINLNNLIFPNRKGSIFLIDVSMHSAAFDRLFHSCIHVADSKLYGIYLQKTSSDTIELAYANGTTAGTSARRSLITTGTVSLNTKYNIVAVVRDALEDMSIFIDAKDQAGSYSGTGTTYSQGTSPGAYNILEYAGTKYYGDTNIGGILTLDVDVSDAIAFELSDNPQQLWTPPSFTYYSFGADTGSTLLPNSINQAQSIDNINLIQQNILAPNDLNQNQSIDNLDLIQQNILAVDDSNQPQSIDNVELIQQNILVIDEIVQSQSIDNLDLIQANILVINDIDQGQSIDNIILETGIILQINDINQSQALDNIDLTQAHVLAIGDISQAQNIDNITLSAGVILQIADIAQSQNIDIINLIQQSTVVVDSIYQSQSIDNIVLDTAVILQIADIIQNQSIDNLNPSQAHILAVNDLLQAQSIDNITFARLEGKVTITFILSKPGITKTLSSPGATFTGE